MANALQVSRPEIAGGDLDVMLCSGGRGVTPQDITIVGDDFPIAKDALIGSQFLRERGANIDYITDNLVIHGCDLPFMREGGGAYQVLEGKGSGASFVDSTRMEPREFDDLLHDLVPLGKASGPLFGHEGNFRVTGPVTTDAAGSYARAGVCSPGRSAGVNEVTHDTAGAYAYARVRSPGCAGGVDGSFVGDFVHSPEQEVAEYLEEIGNVADEYNAWGIFEVGSIRVNSEGTVEPSSSEHSHLRYRSSCHRRP